MLRSIKPSHRYPTMNYCKEYQPIAIILTENKCNFKISANILAFSNNFCCCCKLIKSHSVVHNMDSINQVVVHVFFVFM